MGKGNVKPCPVRFEKTKEKKLTIENVELELELQDLENAQYSKLQIRRASTMVLVVCSMLDEQMIEWIPAVFTIIAVYKVPGFQLHRARYKIHV